MKKPSIVQKEMIPHMKGLGVFIEMKKKKKIADSKNVIFQVSKSQYFLPKFHGLVLGAMMWLNLYDRQAVRCKLKKEIKTKQKCIFTPL